MTIAQQLRALLDSHDLTLYKASKIVGAETDEELATIHKRLSRFVGNKPQKAIWQLERDCKALGYEVKIVDAQHRTLSPEVLVGPISD